VKSIGHDWQFKQIAPVMAGVFDDAISVLRIEPKGL
jgi:hypothetical protein